MSKDKKIKVECFTSNLCSNCKQAKTVLTEVIEVIGAEYFELEFIDVIKNIDRSVEAGVLTTPSLLVNLQLVCSTFPSPAALNEILKTSLNDYCQQAAIRDI
ncbi:MAG: thioredoxin family protein [Gammaproteobacteria bacterium]|nr:thioredoxin family protein [Gammaproteobacteria bacterium]